MQSLIRHLGGKNNFIGSREGENLALILFRALTNSGAATRQYLSVSQKRPWQSIACSGRPHNPLNV